MYSIRIKQIRNVQVSCQFYEKNSDSVNTLVTDTNSFIYEISENPYEIMHQSK